VVICDATDPTDEGQFVSEMQMTTLGVHLYQDKFAAFKEISSRFEILQQSFFK